MKTLGLIGGMSWESTVPYYQTLNRLVREELGGLHSAKLLLWSFDFAEIEALQAQGDWDTATQEMVTAAKRLESAGADAVMVCTNTMHLMFDSVAAAVSAPVLHIADAAGQAIHSAGCRKPLLLATRFTMEMDFYKGRMKDGFGLDVQVPDETDRALVYQIIYEELCKGAVLDTSRAVYMEIIDKMIARGCDSVIFGCTEIGLLLNPDDISVPSFDTCFLHARMGTDFMLASGTVE
ncbi:aspartate racemase [Kordiimonas sediminis]|uniref:Aspartate racemase n=1 Tax=Kordiimonas sediminis TaxID=1735581 RepID=A0A919E8B1_9PROT|nr:aspartate/glutamate racemase family protein [Kordiimonas sediminis]GHF22852.1 aspartate racemase [Kordiimonas sediminis]